MKKVGLILILFFIAGISVSFKGVKRAYYRLAFEEVTIGKQVWMTQNLTVDKFRNGDLIPQVKTIEEWNNACKKGQPVWCYYDNDTSNGAIYGKLYNWYAVKDSRGLAPQGWKIPSDAEWTVLTDYLGGDEVSGEKMKSSRGWYENGNGNNNSGFSGLPGGLIDDGGDFYGIGINCAWWSSTKVNEESAWGRLLSYETGTTGRYEYLIERAGFYVRCIKY